MNGKLKERCRRWVGWDRVDMVKLKEGVVVHEIRTPPPKKKKKNGASGRSRPSHSVEAVVGHASHRPRLVVGHAWQQNVK